MSPAQPLHSPHPTRSDIVAAARSLVGVLYTHQGRSRMQGLDCVGLLIETANIVGLDCADFPGYSRAPDGTLTEKMGTSLELANRKCVHCHMPGDILCFTINSEPQHVAIRTDYGIVHALSDSVKVNETSYDERWRRRLHSVWVWPEVDDVELLEKAAPARAAAARPMRKGPCRNC